MTPYRRRAAKDIAERRPAATLTPIMRKLVNDSAAMMATGPADAARAASDARAYAVDHLEELHQQTAAAFTRRGVGYHRASSPEMAVATILNLLAGSRRVAKSKTMTGEEIGLTHALRSAGMDVLETDIGEYIVDIEGRGPSHITAPAVHLGRGRIRELLARAGADLDTDDPEVLSRHVRDVVATFFADCDAAITGANAVIAGSGRVVAVENEGNVALGVSHPRMHIIVTGIEKVVADEAAALAVLQVLAPKATAQPLTAFTHFLADPLPGQERHVVFVDHGRSRIAQDPRYRDVLKCVRCGACMNNCPVYRAAGGLSYGSPYMGPIGAVISPLLWRDGRYADLPFASSLCGACTEACPVGIPLHRMLLDLRADAVQQHHVADRKERMAWRAWAATFGGATRARAATALVRIGLKSTGRLIRPPDRDRADPRLLPDPAAVHDPELVSRAAPDRTPKPLTPPAAELPADPAALFAARAGALGMPFITRSEVDSGPPAYLVTATAVVAATGSVLLTGEAARKRPLLEAGRVVVTVDPATVVRHPAGLAPWLGDGECLLLTGPSRTADIEKVIVRGIHGSQDYALIWK